MRITLKIDLTGDVNKIEDYMFQLSRFAFDKAATYGYDILSVDRFIDFDKHEAEEPHEKVQQQLPQGAQEIPSEQPPQIIPEQPMQQALPAEKLNSKLSKLKEFYGIKKERFEVGNQVGFVQDKNKKGKVVSVDAEKEWAVVETEDGQKVTESVMNLFLLQ